ncbi:MAG: dihydrolipoamide acetyltransferase family protein [Chloroflexota bacterium]
MAEVTMPRLSDTMLEGTVSRWLKQPGDHVDRGEILVEIETDKATMELEAYESGVLQQVLVPVGQTVPIGQPIALIGQNGVSATDAPAVTMPAPAPASQPEPVPARIPTVAESGPSPDGVRASPMARRIARERGLDLHRIQGTGPHGRVTRSDVETALVEVPAAAAQPLVTDGPDQTIQEIPLSGMRRTIARRLTESMQTAPHFYVTSVVDVSALVQVRAQMNQQLTDAGEAGRISVNDFIVKAAALSLRAMPEVNVSYGGDRLLRKSRIHVGIAVALENGLVVPVVRDADRASLGEISRATRDLAERARAGKLAPAELTGGTFTVSNLGMFGVEQFTAVINPPEAAILAVGGVATEPAYVEGQLVPRERMRLTLSVDHRALDGATGARFLQRIKSLLESPLRMLI